MFSGKYHVEFPDLDASKWSQDEEYCLIKEKEGNESRKIGFHEYGKIYAIPGLYEYLFHERLKCKSPEKVCELLAREFNESSQNIAELVVLDLGAGNGMVGEQLRSHGLEMIYGIDIEEEAKKAVGRDRPGVYTEYFVADLLNPPGHLLGKLKEKSFDCLITVGALGFEDIPPKVFAEGFNLISLPGFVAFNIKEDFLSDNDPTGFSFLIHKMIDKGIFEVRLQEFYQHRLSVKGDPFYYFAIIGNKKAHIPSTWL